MGGHLHVVCIILFVCESVAFACEGVRVLVFMRVDRAMGKSWFLGLPHSKPTAVHHCSLLGGIVGGRSWKGFGGCGCEA